MLQLSLEGVLSLVPHTRPHTLPPPISIQLIFFLNSNWRCQHIHTYKRKIELFLKQSNYKRSNKQASNNNKFTNLTSAVTGGAVIDASGAEAREARVYPQRGGGVIDQ